MNINCVVFDSTITNGNTTMDTKALRQKILDLAIRGKLVPQDPNDEPASVLLERIKAEKERLIKEGKIKRSKKAAKTSDTPHYGNVPFEVPDNWVWTIVGEVGEVITGSTPSKDIAEYYGGDIPFYKPTDLDLGINTNSASDTLTIEGYNLSRKLPAGSILVTCIGATIGKTGLISTEGACNQQINAIIPSSLITSTFLYYSCISEYFQKEIRNHASATTLPILNKNNFTKLLIPLPPLSEQQRIVKEIERWFALIEQIEQSKADLQTTIKQTKSKILDIAIHGKLVPQDPNDEPAIELLKRINPNFTPCDNGHYTQLPEGWSICKLSKLCKIENGFAFSSNDYKSEGTPLIRISNIVNNSIDLTDCVYIQNNAEYRFVVNKGDLLIAMSGATTGKMGVYSFERTAFLNQRVGNIKILNGSLLSADYRNVYMQSKVDDILKFAYGGAQPNISASVIGDFDILLPPLEEQKRIVCTVNKVFTKLDTIMESL